MPLPTILYVTSQHRHSSFQNTEATFQDLQFFSRSFPQSEVFVPPSSLSFLNKTNLFFRDSHLYYGLRNAARNVDLVHIIEPVAADRLVYCALYNRKVVFTINTSPSVYHSLSNIQKLQWHFVAPTAAIAQSIQQQGCRKVSIIPTGVNTQPYNDLPPPPPLHSSVHILFASCPWNQKGFGIRAIPQIFEAARQCSFIHLHLVWRGKDVAEIRRLLDYYQVAARVSIYEGWTDVPMLMQNMHAAAVFCSPSHYVKSFPNSLQEALTAKRPVLLNEAIGLSEVVHQYQCGIVTNNCSADEIAAAYTRLYQQYYTLQNAAAQIPPRYFDSSRTLAIYQQLYEQEMYSTFKIKYAQ